MRHEDQGIRKDQPEPGRHRPAGGRLPHPGHRDAERRPVRRGGAEAGEGARRPPALQQGLPPHRQAQHRLPGRPVFPGALRHHRGGGLPVHPQAHPQPGGHGGRQRRRRRRAAGPGPAVRDPSGPARPYGAGGQSGGRRALLRPRWHLPVHGHRRGGRARGPHAPLLPGHLQAPRGHEHPPGLRPAGRLPPDPELRHPPHALRFGEGGPGPGGRYPLQPVRRDHAGPWAP